MGKKKYFGVYSLSKEQQDKMIEQGLWNIRHMGNWVLEEGIKEWYGAIAVMKSHAIYWDTTIPSLLKMGLQFNIEPKMNYMLIVIYPTKRVYTRLDLVKCKFCGKVVDMKLIEKIGGE